MRPGKEERTVNTVRERVQAATPRRPWDRSSHRPEPEPRSAALGWAYRMSSVIATLMIAASVAGLFVHGLYREGAWAREALRGGDLVTLLVGAPTMIAALILARRGSLRAQAVWLGMLAYSVYNYAYYVFGATFNDVFLLHIALFSMSTFALALALTTVDVRAIGSMLRVDRTARWMGGFLVVVGVLQGLLWVFVLVRYVANGELIEHIPVDGQHLVFALDLGLLVPGLVVAGVLLWRRAAMGFMLGAAMAVMGAVYQLNLMIGGLFQAHANVAGIKAFPPESILLTTAFVVVALLLVRGRRSVPR
jgi:hypothetical protein